MGANKFRPKAFYALVCALSTEGFALIDFPGGIGYKSVTIKSTTLESESSSKLAGPEIQGSLHVDPFPVLPFSFGGTLHYATLSGGTNPENVKGWGLDLEARIWYPFMSSSFTPFFKGGYTVGGDYRVKTQEETYTCEPSGLAVSAGLRYDIIFRNGVFIQATYRSTKLTHRLYTQEENSISALLGGQVGF
jgi:hypothetical protein